MEKEFRLEGFTVVFSEKGGKFTGFVKEIPQCRAESPDMLTFRMELRAAISEYVVSHASF